MRRQLIRKIGLVSLLVLGVVSNGSAPAQAGTFAGTNGKIAFVSYRDGNPEVYSMGADGSGQTNLTNAAANEGGPPSWSPDGSKIAFATDRDGNSEVYSMGADGSGLTNLTNNSAVDGTPSWSPDGTKIAFATDRDGNAEIYVMNADGTDQTNLTNAAAGYDLYPAWSPDGTKIAFMSARDGDYDIYVMNADGTDQTNLTNNPGVDYTSSWSPDGSKIAFTSYRDISPEIYVMNADGTGQINLTNNAADDREPSWSPDGTKIAFTSDRDGNYEIYSMNADGSSPTRLTFSPVQDVEPSWGTSGGPPSDSIRPVITASRTPVANAHGWNNTDVVVSFSCADELGGSGIQTDTVAGATLAGEGAGQSVTNSGSCTDGAGNTALSVTVNDISIDKTAPVISCTSGTFAFGSGIQSVAVAAGDGAGAGSGVDTDSSTLTGAVDTSTAGTYSVTFTAIDYAGNSDSQACVYQVSLAAANQAVADSLDAFQGDKNVAKALAELNTILSTGGYFIDATHLNPANGAEVFNALQRAVGELSKVKNPPPAVTAAVASLVQIAQVLAQTAIDEAPAGKEQSKALDEMAKAAEKLAKGHSPQAIDHYAKAWERALKA